MQKAICRALKTAVQDRKEVMDLIISNLSYAVTGENNVLDTYVIELADGNDKRGDRR